MRLVKNLCSPLARSDHACLADRDSVRGGDISERPPILSNRAHVVIREFGVEVLRSALMKTRTIAVASGFDHVSHVVGMGSHREVLRVQASRVVTEMSHEKTLRDRPDEVLVREPVSADHSTRPTVEQAITPLMGCAAPEPAAVGFLDLFKPPFVKRHSARRHEGIESTNAIREHTIPMGSRPYAFIRLPGVA